MFTYLNHVLGLNFLADALYFIAMCFAIIGGSLVSQEVFAQAGVQFAEDQD
jgi:hypothetical protein